MPISEVGSATVPAAAEPGTPRRKRRRTAATGAANDCFTCASRNASCDRKRPYCTTCLDGGTDCAGYKTTLTWGVGVASRGKLRGLALPIPGSGKQKPSVRSKNLCQKIESTRPELQRQHMKKSETMARVIAPFTPSPTSSASDKPDLEPSSITSAPWQSAPSPTYMSPPAYIFAGLDGAVSRDPPDSSLEDPSQSGGSDRTIFTAASSASAESHGERFRNPFAGLSQSTSYPRNIQSPEVPRSYSLNLTNEIEQQHVVFGSGRGCNHDSLSPGISDDSSIVTVQHIADISGLGIAKSPPVATDCLQNTMEANRSPRTEECQLLEHLEYNIGTTNLASSVTVNEQSTLTLYPFSGRQAVGKTPRMQYLINYYSEVISPVIVAFDGPTNPYRSYILRLASGSETLQHAISALSASNLRQRRESGELSTGKTAPARRSSMAHQKLTDTACQSSPGFLSVKDQRKEENYHKNATVQLIQRQFADPSQHRDDSVLATLLVVCLFHICESGVAKFKTHFAGAKKLLGMRGGESISRSKEAKWFTRMFTWFDAMTATVNQREGQMEDGLLDLSSLCDEDWTLENLTGCDGKLFKIIAKLSRLNILIQKGATDSTAPTASCSTPMILPDPAYWNSFDGNSWASTLDNSTHTLSDAAYPEINTNYGREWHETRNALISWQLDTSLFGSSRANVPDLSREQQLDLFHISESFRCSALIYIERLARPDVPSSNRYIQSWVQKALYFIQLVRSDVYLLWPLFVTGSECVATADRHIIRERCLDIQKDSGFSNNASCLKLLEKIWASSSSSAFGLTDQPSGFRWRSVMESSMSRGEYIVV